TSTPLFASPWPAGAQSVPPLRLFSTPLEVPAYTVEVACGSTATDNTNGLIACGLTPPTQEPPPSVLRIRPFPSSPAYSSPGAPPCNNARTVDPAGTP